MADKEYKVKLSTDSSDAVSGINNTTDALNNLATAEDNVAKSTKAAGTALKGIGDQSASIENAENSIKSLQGATELVAGSIVTSVGALALFGAESEKVGEIEKKVQGAIAIALGVREAGEGALLLVQQRRFIQEKALQAATKVSTAVQAAYNAVVSANPIALIVLAIAGFIAGLIALKDRIQIVSDAFEFANKKFQQFLEFIGLGISEEEKAAKASRELASAKEKQLSRELELLKAKGATEKEIYDQSRAILIEQLLQLKQGTDEYADVQFAILALDEEFKRKQNEAAEKQRNDEKAAEDKRREELKKRAEGIAKDAELVGLDAEAKARLLAKREFDERVKGFEEGSQTYLNALKIFRGQISQIEQEAADADFDKLNEEFDKRVEAEITRQQSLKDLLTSFREEQENIDADTIAKQINLAEDRALAELELLGATEEQKGKIIEFYAGQRLENQKTINQSLIQLELELVNAIGSVFGQLASLAEEGTATQKALALTEIAISTAAGFVNGLIIAQKAAKAAPGPAAPFIFGIFYAQQIAAVLGAANQAKKILSAVPGGGSGPSISPPSIGGGGGGAQNSAAGFFQPGLGNQGLPSPQGAPNNTGLGNDDGVIRAYVLAGDVTSAQAANAKLKQKRTL